MDQLRHPVRQDIHNSDVPVLCRACEARHGGICGALEPRELVSLGRTASRHEHEAGTTLVAAGETPEHFSNLLSGVVKLSKILPDGRQQIVELQFAPDFIGRPFSGTNDILVEAATHVRLCSFARVTLERLTETAPAVERRLHRQSLRQLDEARDWMMTLGRKTATEKVASFLLLLARHMEPHRDGPTHRFDLPLSRSDIADFLGLTIETVSRQITQLRKAGIVEIEKNRSVLVCDFPALEARAGG